MNNQQQKPPVRRQINDSLIEQLRELGRGVSSGVTDQLIGGVANDALNSFFGVPKSGNLQPGQEVRLGKTAATQPASPPAAEQPFNPFALPGAERFPFPMRKREAPRASISPEVVSRLRQQEAQVAHKIDEIRMEIKALIAEVKTVDKEIKEAADGQVVSPDTYHLNYLDRIKVMLKNMLKQLTESRSWLSTQKSRRKQRGYWAMYKKRGTTFGLSHERVVATQTG
jgi:hypothetical protein